MKELEFYNAGGHQAKGARKLLVIVRRVVRRVLKPIFQRQAEIFHYLACRLDEVDTRVERHEHAVFALRIDADDLKARHAELAARQAELSEQVQTALALGWDYVAFVRRLAILEDQVAGLSGSYPTAVEEGEGHASILFPGLEKATRPPAPAVEPEPHAQVS